MFVLTKEIFYLAIVECNGTIVLMQFKRSGFTLVEVIVSIAILIVVSFAIVHFVGTAKKATVKIEDISGCQVVAQSFMSDISNYGQNLNPSVPVVSLSQVVEGDEFSGAYNALPVVERLSPTSIRANTSQLTRGSAATLMAVYNRKGDNSYCVANDGKGVELESDAFEVKGLANGVAYLRIEPIVFSTRQSVTPVCPNPPLYFGAPSHQGNYNVTPPVLSSEPSIVLPERDRGFKVTITIEYTTGGKTQSCSTENHFGFSFDPLNNSVFANAVLNSENLSTFQFDTNSDSILDTEYLTCGVNGSGSQGFRNISITVPVGPNGIEFGSALICRGRILADPIAAVPVAGSVGQWDFCDQFVFPEPGGSALQTVQADASQVLFNFSQLTSDLTYQLELGSIDSGGNFSNHFITFSVDGSRPLITGLRETTNLINAPDSDYQTSTLSWPQTLSDSGIQCTSGQTTFRGDVSGALLQRTFLNCDGTGFNGALTFAPYTCTGNHSATENRMNQVEMLARDRCGLGFAQSFSWPVLTEVPDANPGLQTSSPQGLLINHKLIAGFPEYSTLIQDYCDCENSVTTQNFCAAGVCGAAHGSNPEMVKISVVDACGKNFSNEISYCPTNAWSPLPTLSWWGRGRCTATSGLAENQVCREVTTSIFGSTQDFPGCFAVAGCGAGGVGDLNRCIANNTPNCTSSATCQLQADECYACACNTINPNGFEAASSCQTELGSLTPAGDWLCEIANPTSTTCYAPFNCPGNSWATEAACRANNSGCSVCEPLPGLPGQPVPPAQCWACRCDASTGEYPTQEACNSARTNPATQVCGEVMGSEMLCWRHFDCPGCLLNQAGALFFTGGGSITHGLQSQSTCASGSCPSIDMNGTGANQAGGVCYLADLGNCPEFENGPHITEESCRSSVGSNFQCRDFEAALVCNGNLVDTLPTQCWYGAQCPSGYGTQEICEADGGNICDPSPGLFCETAAQGCWECNATTTTTTLPEENICEPPFEFEEISECHISTLCGEAPGETLCNQETENGVTCYLCSVTPTTLPAVCNNEVGNWTCGSGFLAPGAPHPSCPDGAIPMDNDTLYCRGSSGQTLDSGCCSMPAMLCWTCP